MLVPSHQLPLLRKVDSAICPPTSVYPSAAGFEVAWPQCSTRHGLLAVWVLAPLASPKNGGMSSSPPCLLLERGAFLSLASAEDVSATRIEDRRVRICHTCTDAQGKQHTDCMRTGMRSQKCIPAKPLHRSTPLRTNHTDVRSSGSRDSCLSSPRGSESRSGAAARPPPHRGTHPCANL